MVAIIDFLLQLKQWGIHLKLSGEKLQIRKNCDSQLTPTLLAEIKLRKQEIIEFLRDFSLPYCSQDLTAVPRSARMPLSVAQQRMWQRSNSETMAELSIYRGLNIRGRLDIDVLKQAYQLLILRHEALRTQFEEYQGLGYQQVLEGHNANIDVLDISGLCESEKASFLLDFESELVFLDFDLSAGALIKASLIQCAEDEYVLYIAIHHISVDAWSFFLLKRDLERLYNQCQLGHKQQLTPLPVQVIDYAVWEKEFLQSSYCMDLSRRWRDRVNTDFGFNELPVVASYTDRDLTSQTEVLLIADEQLADLRVFCKFSQVSESVCLLSVLALALDKHVKYRDLIHRGINIGMPFHGRPSVQTQELIGFFANMLVVSLTIDHAGDFNEFLTRVNHQVTTCMRYQDIPLAKLMDGLPLPDDPSYRFFQVTYNFMSYDFKSVPIPELQITVRPERRKKDISVFDLGVSTVDLGSSIEVYFGYRTKMLMAEKVQAIKSDFAAILASVLYRDPSPEGY